MVDIGESTELVNELALESTAQDEDGWERKKWHKQVALSTLVMAVFAAVSGLLAGITAQTALLDRTAELIEYSILEGDRVNVEVLKAKHDLLISLGETPDEDEVNQIEAFEIEIKQLVKQTSLDETSVNLANTTHLIFSISVTLLAIGITIGGMSIIVELKWLWMAGMVFGAAGIIGVGIGMYSMFL